MGYVRDIPISESKWQQQRLGGNTTHKATRLKRLQATRSAGSLSFSFVACTDLKTTKHFKDSKIYQNVYLSLVSPRGRPAPTSSFAPTFSNSPNHPISIFLFEPTENLLLPIGIILIENSKDVICQNSCLFFLQLQTQPHHVQSQHRAACSLRAPGKKRTAQPAP